MKHILMGAVLVSFAVCSASARQPATQTEVFHPTTSVDAVRPLTKVDIIKPVTSVQRVPSQTQVEVLRPKTGVQTFHPSTQVQVVRPQTEVVVIAPQTNVEVFHPRTTVEVFHPQTFETTNVDKEETADAGKSGGKKVKSSLQKTTSMSDFKPMQAKDLAVNKSTTDKAQKTGGGDVNLGNDTNQTEKDNVNKSSTLGAQKGATQNLDVDPTRSTSSGLEKLLTDRAKFERKRQ